MLHSKKYSRPDFDNASPKFVRARVYLPKMRLNTPVGIGEEEGLSNKLLAMRQPDCNIRDCFGDAKDFVHTQSDISALDDSFEFLVDLVGDKADTYMCFNPA